MQSRFVRQVATIGLMVALTRCSEGTLTLKSCPAGEIATAQGCLPLHGSPGGTEGPHGSVDSTQGSSDASTRDDADIDPSGKDGHGGVDASAERGPNIGALVELAGTWALRESATELVTSSNRNGDTTVVSLSLVTITQSDRSLTLTVRLCDIDQTSYLGYRIDWSRAAAESAGDVVTTATLDSTRVGGRITVASRAEMFGWRTMNNPGTDTLPSTRDDGRVLDTDGDGNVGITLDVTQNLLSANVYVSARRVIDLDGTITTEATIEGTTHSTYEQATLGSNNNLLSLPQATFRQTQDRATNGFRMTRLPITIDATCGAIRQQRNTLFP